MDIWWFLDRISSCFSNNKTHFPLVVPPSPHFPPIQVPTIKSLGARSDTLLTPLARLCHSHYNAADPGPGSSQQGPATGTAGGINCIKCVMSIIPHQPLTQHAEDTLGWPHTETRILMRNILQKVKEKEKKKNLMWIVTSGFCLPP